MTVSCSGQHGPLCQWGLFLERSRENNWGFLPYLLSWNWGEMPHIFSFPGLLFYSTLVCYFKATPGRLLPSEMYREKWVQSLCSSACPHLQAKPTLELAHWWFSFPMVPLKSVSSSFRTVHLSLQQTWLCRTGKIKFPHNKQDWGLHSLSSSCPGWEEVWGLGWWLPVIVLVLTTRNPLGKVSFPLDMETLLHVY